MRSAGRSHPSGQPLHGSHLGELALGAPDARDTLQCLLRDAARVAQLVELSPLSLEVPSSCVQDTVRADALNALAFSAP
jgi:hypothetical protein